MYFHRTDWASAFEIIEYGIDIDRCSGNPTEFGLKCFYVGDNFSLSLNWARIRYIKYVAVLCYSVSSLQFSERESKIFETADLEWSTAVYQFRCAGIPYRRSMCHYHLMMGPINAVNSAAGSVKDNLLQLAGDIITKLQKFMQALHYALTPMMQKQTV